MKLTIEGRDTIEKTRLISRDSFDKTKEFYESLFSIVILNYLEDKSTVIPYFGEITLTYDGDDILPGGKVARINFNFIPDANLQKVIGQISDGDETEIELEQILINKAVLKLEEKLEIY